MNRVNVGNDSFLSRLRAHQALSPHYLLLMLFPG